MKIQVNEAKIIRKSSENHQKSRETSTEISSGIINLSPLSFPCFGGFFTSTFQQQNRILFGFGELRSSPVRFLRFPDLDLDALEVGGDLQWQEPSDDSHSAAARGLIWVDGGVVDA